MNELQHLLNKVNKVTAYHRHGNAIPKSALDELSNAQLEYEKSFPVEKRVMLNFADIKKEFEERFCFSYMENGEKLINDFMWKTSDNTMNVWEWVEQKLKEASKISA